MGILTSKDLTLETLLKQINISRCRMQLLWDKKGYTDDEVLAASREVDLLLNEYNRMSCLWVPNPKVPNSRQQKLFS